MSDKLHSMRYAGSVNKGAIEWGFHNAKPGVTLRAVDEQVEWYIRHAGCKPAFKHYQPEGYASPFPSTACISPNDVVVHGIPGDYVLKAGDLVTIDVGTEHDGWFVDAARTRIIVSKTYTVAQNKLEKAEKLLQATESVLAVQLALVKDGCNFLQLIQAAEAEATKWGVAIMPQWGGHAIGEQVHLPPFIPNALDRTQSKIKQQMEERKYAREKLSAGQTICIEPVVTYGSTGIMIDDDGWTIRKDDGQLTAHTERCLLVTKDGYELLS